MDLSEAKCPHCGAVNPAESFFCGECGGQTRSLLSGDGRTLEPEVTEPPAAAAPVVPDEPSVTPEVPVAPAAPVVTEAPAVEAPVAAQPPAPALPPPVGGMILVFRQRPVPGTGSREIDNSALKSYKYGALKLAVD